MKPGRNLTLPGRSLTFCTPQFDLMFLRCDLVDALFGEGGTRLENGYHRQRQSGDRRLSSEAAQRQQVHLEEGVPVHHGEVSVF